MTAHDRTHSASRPAVAVPAAPAGPHPESGGDPGGDSGAGLRIEPLSSLTWDAFAALTERHNGVWGGCWCTWFHRYPDPPERKELGHREFKRQLVERDRAHAALVLDGDRAVAWAEYGPVDELANIHHRKEWEKTADRIPDFRITCLFVDRDYRRKGIASIAVQGALHLIAAAGGGTVEAYPHDLPPGKKTSSSFLYNATRTMYEDLGFDYDRPKGKSNCVMRRVVPRAPS
jgi:GNAT superfamily N-acetyltransferase